jgi:hypothetical protein
VLGLIISADSQQFLAQELLRPGILNYDMLQVQHKHNMEGRARPNTGNPGRIGPLTGVVDQLMPMAGQQGFVLVPG